MSEVYIGFAFRLREERVRVVMQPSYGLMVVSGLAIDPTEHGLMLESLSVDGKPFGVIGPVTSSCFETERAFGRELTASGGVKPVALGVGNVLVLEFAAAWAATHAVFGYVHCNSTVADARVSVTYERAPGLAATSGFSEIILRIDAFCLGKSSLRTR